MPADAREAISHGIRAKLQLQIGRRQLRSPRPMRRGIVMHQSSNSIANLAAALAKAQMALVNPEKSLVATIRQGGASGSEQAFRYAPLSSGLEIVRKTLGAWESPRCRPRGDRPGGSSVVNLTTVLAHSSGKWISSEWPVCALSETADPAEWAPR